MLQWVWRPSTPIRSGVPIAIKLTFVFSVLCSANLLAQSEMAQISPPSSDELSQLQGLADRVSIDVTAFNITGGSPIGIQKSKAILDQYIGPDKGIDDIEAAAEALENQLRKQGESFYRVSFPPQELSDGVVDLLITRYTVGEIIVSGNKHYSNSNIVRSLPQLKPGSSPSSRAMARSLTVANQNSGKRTRLTLATSKIPGQIDATLTVVDQKPQVFNAWVNNTGTEASGDYRIGASATHRNMFGLDHTASLTFISSPEDFNEVQQFALSYRAPIYSLGGSLDMFAVKSEVDSGTVAEVFEVAGSGDVYGLGYSQVLSKIKEYRHQVSAQLTDKLFDNDIRFQQTQIATDVRSRPVTLAYQGSWNNGAGLELRGSLSWIENLSGGSDNTDLAYELTRTGATRDWSKVNIDLQLQLSRGSWLYTAGLNYVDTSDRLITGEQFALGGDNSIRGMEERELTGDQGYRLNLAAWGPSIAKNLRPILFIDLGKAELNQSVDNEYQSESVASTGIMFNWNPTEHITASASYGYLLDGIDSQSDVFNNASRDGDGKLHFNVGYRF